MARYSLIGQRTMDTTNGIAAMWTVTNLIRSRVLDIVFGCDGTPGDTAMTLRVQRSTTAATGGTSWTPLPLDSADVACRTVAMTGTLTNGTTTASAYLLELACNQRATVRWFAAPGEELVIPATASNGLHFLTPVAPALSGRCAIVFDE